MREISFADLINRYKTGEKDFSNVDIMPPECFDWKPGQFRGLNLSGIILQNSAFLNFGSCIDGIIFCEADLTNVDFGECNIAGADFSKAIMRNTKFWQTEADSAIFREADLTGSSFSETSLFCSDMTEANLSNTIIKETTFCAAILTDAIFSGAKLKSVDFEEAILIRANFRNASFWSENIATFGVNFKGCHFENTIMPDGSIRNNN